MSKVVTERPRYGHSNPSLKTAMRIRRYDENREYDFPTRAPISRGRQYGYDAKEFSDLIGPLQRFLQKRVGQHWDKVYSEMSESLDKRSLTGRHIWTHVWQEVERHCEIGEDRKVYRKAPCYGCRVEIYKDLYIHPKTGILCRRKK